MSTEGELRYNARIPVGCVAGDNISTYLMLQHCRKRGQPVPVDQKFVLREVRDTLKPLTGGWWTHRLIDRESSSIAGSVLPYYRVTRCSSRMTPTPNVGIRYINTNCSCILLMS